MLIGSRALAFHIPEYPLSPDADYDIIGEGEHALDKLFNEQAVALYNDPRTEVCSLKGLMLIKRSHLWRDWQWDKHIVQYYHWIKKYCTDKKQRSLPLTKEDLEFLKKRTKLTQEAYGDFTPSLDKSPKDFFDDYVTKIYDHDFLHELVAFENKPLYLSLQKDPKATVFCSKSLWNTLTPIQQNRCVAEEAFVIALERFVLSNWDYPTKLAYYNALKKICTTLTRGFFRDHAIDNFPDIFLLYDKGKFEQWKKALPVML